MKKIALIPSLSPDSSFVEIAKGVFDAGLDVVVVNDGSPVECDPIFDAIAEFADVLSYRTNMGKGYALKYALKHIKEKYADEEYVVVTMDSDGQHKVEDALRVLDEAIADPDALVLGSRKLDKSCPRKSRVGNWMARTTFFLFTHAKVYDTQTGLRAFNKKIIDLIIGAKGDRYEYEMNMLLDCVRAKVQIKEVDIAVIYIDNNSGSHYNPLKDTMKIFWELIKFSLSSLIGFLVDYGLYSLFLFVFPDAWLQRVLIANVVARVISASVNFTINYNLVFKKREKLWSAALKYFLLALFILGCNTGILWLLVDKAKLNEFVAKIIVEAVMFVVSWLVQRFFVFRKRKND
ncbi:MAG: bifunctional glycosyltransferase family 2/GtrA family protein [Bacilli bacterium]|nr:bifunctional glycosyltransferase family 2/GtrA family protein [Bacilli bacterium]